MVSLTVNQSGEFSRRGWEMLREREKESAFWKPADQCCGSLPQRQQERGNVTRKERRSFRERESSQEGTHNLKTRRKTYFRREMLSESQEEAAL